MMSAVPDGEFVWRSAVFPVAFKKKQLSNKAYFRLYASDATPFVLEMSLVREKYAPALFMIHGFGCRLAASRNRALVKDGKPANRVYCGAYQIKVEDIRSLARLPQLSEVKKAQVLHIVEDSELAHSNMQIEVDTGGDEDAIEPIKTLIVDRIWSKSRGPSRHVCRRDKGLADHPSKWLTAGPNGAHVDGRSRLRVFIDVTRCLLGLYPRLWIRLKAEHTVSWLKSALSR
jgi:hypothetical protein